MGQAKRRKERLGDAYGTLEGTAPMTDSTSVPTAVVLLSPQNHGLIMDHISKDDGIDLVEHCKRPGPWERRYIPVEKHRDRCKEVVITCTGDDVVACFWPACRADQAPSRLHVESLQAPGVDHANA